jgi:hypothetical protein
LHASGCNPGGIAERFPLTFTGWCNRIDRITMTECGDCRELTSPAIAKEVMNLGKTPGEARANPVMELIASSWYEPIDMIAEGLGADDRRGVGHGGEGHDCAQSLPPHRAHPGGTEIVQEQIWYMDDIQQTRLESKMDIPRESGWRIRIEGDVNLVIDVDFPPGLTQEERVAQGMSTTGFHLVNAVPPVCETGDPGIKTYLDLPMITGRMGLHSVR